MKQYDIIRGPVVTEKTTLQKETNNQVTLKVDPKANRVEIKDAVEKNFNTKVKQVRTVQVKGKVKPGKRKSEAARQNHRQKKRLEKSDSHTDARTTN